MRATRLAYPLDLLSTRHAIFSVAPFCACCAPEANRNILRALVELRAAFQVACTLFWPGFDHEPLSTQPAPGCPPLVGWLLAVSFPWTYACLHPVIPLVGHAHH